MDHPTLTPDILLSLYREARQLHPGDDRAMAKEFGALVELRAATERVGSDLGLGPLMSGYHHALRTAWELAESLRAAVNVVDNGPSGSLFDVGEARDRLRSFDMSFVEEGD
ncbi:MAG: hypothetical protein CMQ40_12985 [Gammaproteobacteria bacterium]|nr:hypothetical protein [Gammaproteobacteria bacterium]